MKRTWITVDGNEATALVAHKTNEVIAIYPITPSSNMGELADEWSAKGKKNLWGVIPDVTEMQSEAGAIGAVHGALQSGALSTTFTASQGLLLMIPNLYKIAGELTPFCMHVAARTVATHALSIFGDHSDVMACRQTGVMLLSSASVQEAHDFALIGQAATLRSRLPVLHFFDGFRTSHEVAKIEALTEDDMRAMLPADLIAAHRARALSPEAPTVRGTAQNPDAFFQAREACNPFYAAAPGIVQQVMDEFAALSGRAYHLFDYHGDPQATRVIVIMGSGGETVVRTVGALNARGAKVGVLSVRLYRPFDASAFLTALPTTVTDLAVLDRTKEPGAPAEPMYLDVITALHEGQASATPRFARMPRVIGGRYGLSSKEFTPAMVNTVFESLKAAAPLNHFTIGITDDVTGLSLKVDDSFDIEPADETRAVFFGLGADGTVGANKNSIKIIGEETPNYAQGYFVYDSKKSGAITISHLRFGPREIRAPYLVTEANFVGCHQFVFLEKYDVLGYSAPGSVFLLNSPFDKDAVWDELPREVQAQILEKRLRFYVIDAYAVAKANGMGTRINTIMQTCFFAISGVLPRDEAIEKIKGTIEKTYGRRGPDVVKRNFAAVDDTLAHLEQVTVPAAITATRVRPPMVATEAPDFVQRVTATMLANKGDLLPVSAFPIDGTWPTGTAQWEKRNIALEIPEWDPSICIQCNKCALVCPHAAIRAKVFPTDQAAGAPATFKHVPFKGNEFKGLQYSLQVAPEDCTGCAICVAMCPAKDKSNPKHKAIDMVAQPPLREQERDNYAFFLDIPEVDRESVKIDVKGTQFLQPLFEYSGACSGCGETPYVKLLTQMYGDRLFIANATGCSSIYGGNLPTTPYTTDAAGRGPAWANSLFEDNAEFGMGFRLAIDYQEQYAKSLLASLSAKLPPALVEALATTDQSGEHGIKVQRGHVAALRTALAGIETPEAKVLSQVADLLVRKSVWIVGGDGWAYDIGYGGLDHVMASGRNVNILVLDTEVYSNTGGQASKATPRAAAAKFAMAGKPGPKKDLGLMAMAYGNVYVANVAFGAKDVQTVKAFAEAEAHPGPSVIIAFSHCIAHGYDMALGIEQQKLAVETGYWSLFRYDPSADERNTPRLVLDSGAPKGDVGRYMRNETRFRLVEQQDPRRFAELLAGAQQDVNRRWALYHELAHPTPSTPPPSDKH